jgi:hypothetical protein
VQVSQRYVQPKVNARIGLTLNESGQMVRSFSMLRTLAGCVEDRQTPGFSKDMNRFLDSGNIRTRAIKTPNEFFLLAHMRPGPSTARVARVTAAAVELEHAGLVAPLHVRLDLLEDSRFDFSRRGSIGRLLGMIGNRNAIL